GPTRRRIGCEIGEVRAKASRVSSLPQSRRRTRQGKVVMRPEGYRMLSMATDDREMVVRFLRGETDAVGTVDGWISRAAWPYQRRLADRWDDVLQDVRLEGARLLGTGEFRGEAGL